LTKKVKKKRSAPQNAFLRDIARKLNDHIQQSGKSKAEAARELGISKQRLHQYLEEGAMPESDFLCEVSKRWSLDFEYRGWSFGSAAFKTAKGSENIHAEQLSLFDKPQILRNEKWEVRVQRRNPRSFDLSIEIKLVS
jgi:transcriptional regulator with XRE-family HTH domain